MPQSFTILHVMAILVAGFFLIGVVLLIMFSRLKNIQRTQQRQADVATREAQKKEKLVLAAAFANELTENKFKGEAFITIYTELLRKLRDNDQRATYQDTGDFIHKHAPLSRMIFDQNADRLFLLGDKLAADLTRVYAPVHAEPEYFTVEASMPRTAVTRMVELVLDEAQKTIDPIDTMIAALNIIIRDGSKASNEDNT